MSGITFATDYAKLGEPRFMPFPYAKSVTIDAYDVIVLSANSSLTSSSTPVMRSLLAADITALYQDGSSNIVGILGIAPYRAKTDSSGVVDVLNPPTNVNPATQPIYGTTGVGGSLEPDQTTGFSRGNAIIATGGTVFRGRLNTGTASQASVGLAGFALSSGVYTVNLSATTKILNVVGFDREDPTGNAVYFTVLGAYQQIGTGFFYTAQ